MIAVRLTCLLAVLTPLCALVSPASAQSSAGESKPPAIRRWLDVQTLQATTRFRWVKSNAGRITSSTLQWQPQARARLLIDRGARYSITIGAQSGSQFVSGWNNTGAGLGEFGGDFNVKHVWVAAAPIDGLELQAGGLAMLRGQNTEITSYDNDNFIVGERIAWRPPDGTLAEVAVTAGYLGDFRTPNVFRRLKRMDEWNYGQLLVGLRAGPRVNVSADYTYEDGRDILREGATFRLPAAVPVLASVKLEAYQRVSDETGQGFNASGDLRLTRAFTVTAGVAHVDRRYVVPAYTNPNGDRYERGTRFYTLGTYALTREVSIGWFQGEAFSTPYAIPNEHRFEILLSFNPLRTLKGKGVF